MFLLPRSQRFGAGEDHVYEKTRTGEKKVRCVCVCVCVCVGGGGGGRLQNA